MRGIWGLLAVMTACGDGFATYTTLGEASGAVGDGICKRAVMCGAPGKASECREAFVRGICNFSACGEPPKHPKAVEECVEALPKADCAKDTFVALPDVCRGILE